jgi:ribokinase
MVSIHYALNHSREMTTIFNPSPVPNSAEIADFPWQKIDWLLVNEGEALDLYNALTHPALESSTSTITPNTMSDCRLIGEIIAGLSEHPSLCKTNIICTLGKDGVLAFIPMFHKPKSTQDVPTSMYLPAAKLQGTIRDTTGAGDCFTGYFVEGLMEFGPHARVGREIQEEDVARILKRCVQVSRSTVVFGFILWLTCSGRRHMR